MHTRPTVFTATAIAFAAAALVGGTSLLLEASTNVLWWQRATFLVWRGGW
jgi:hypothetical protein